MPRDQVKPAHRAVLSNLRIIGPNREHCSTWRKVRSSRGSVVPERIVQGWALRESSQVGANALRGAW